jgi:hypothetical protein
MLDSKVVEEFVLEEMKDTDTDIPQRINKEELVKAFCQCVEEDYYEWLRDNFNSFFNHGNPDWDWVEKYVQKRIGKSP